MATQAVSDDRAGRGTKEPSYRDETKISFLTTEFWAMVAVIAGILIAAAIVGDDNGGGDQFGARSAWLYVAIVAAGYMISRGLAKSGSSHHHYSDTGDRSARSDINARRDV